MSNQAQLIFLISQPRSGSTLTQKILGNHSKIHTISEPWVLLHPFYALRHEGHTADYNAQWARKVLDTFFEYLPQGKETYITHIAQAYKNMYGEILEGSNKEFFLDKTPRYFHIIPELSAAFPEAHFILLFRNPIAVLCSVIKTWINCGNWLDLHLYKHDILHAPHLLIEGSKLLDGRAMTMQYEKLTENPAAAVPNLCRHLNIEYEEVMLDYDSTNSKKWKLGDQENVYKYQKPNSSNSTHWIKDLENPQVWRLIHDYLNYLGPDVFQSMGYDFNNLQKTIANCHPGNLKLWNTIPLRYLLEEPSHLPSIDYGQALLRLATVCQKENLIGIVNRLGKKLINSNKAK